MADREIVIKISGTLNDQGFVATKTTLKELKNQSDATAASGSGLRESFRGSNESAGILNSTIGRLAASFTIANVIDKVASSLYQMGREAFTDASHILDLSEKLNISTRAAQQYSFALEQTGGSTETLDKAISFMNKTLGEGSTSTRQLLKDLGLDLDHLRQMKTEDTFKAIVNAIAKVPSPTLQANDAVKLLGKSGQDLLPAIREGFLDIAESATVMADRSVRAFDRWGDGLAAAKTRAKSNVGDMLANFGLAVEQTYSYVDEANTRAFQSVQDRAASAKKTTEELNKIFAVTRGAAGDLSVYLQDLPNALGGPERLTDLFAKTERAVDGLTDAQKREIQAGLKLSQSTKDIAESVGVAVEVVDRYKDRWQESTKAIEEHNKAIAKALAQVDDAVSRGRSLGVGSILGVGIGPGGLGGPPRDPRIGGSANVFLDRLALNGTGISLGGPPLRPTTEILNVGGMSSLHLPFSTTSGGQLLAHFASGLGPTVLGAAMGGGSIGKSIAGLGLNTVLSSTTGLASGLGSALGLSGSLALGVGTMGIGAGVMGAIALVKKLTSTAGRDKVEDFANSMGGFDQLHQVLGEQLPKDAERLWVALTQGVGTGNKQQAQKAIDDIKNALKKAGDEAQHLKDVADAFTKTQDDWHKVNELAEKYGVNLETAGGRIQQLGINAKGLTIAEDMKEWINLGGDFNDILPGMQKGVQDLVTEAIKGKDTLPESLKPMVAKLIEMGSLLDENGEKITDIGTLKFEKSPADEFAAIGRTLQEVADKLDIAISKLVGRGGITDAADQAARGVESSFSNVRINIPIDWDVADRPDFGGVDRNPVADIPVSPVNRAGWMYVRPGDIVGMPELGGMSTSGDSFNFSINIDARGSTISELDWQRRSRELLDQIKGAVARGEVLMPSRVIRP